MKKFILIVGLVFLVGCGPTTKIYIRPNVGEIDEKKPDAVIKQSVAGAAVYERFPDGTVKFQVDTRKPTLWERFISPVIKGASDKAQATTPVM